MLSRRSLCLARRRNPCKDAGSLYTLTKRLFASGSKVVEILNENNWETLITDAQKSGKAVIAEFTAVWCPPCRMIAPVLEDLARKHPQVDFVKLDIDNKAVENVVVSHGVAAVPTFVGYKGGNKVGAFSGADRAALTQMVERVKE